MRRTKVMINSCIFSPSINPELLLSSRSLPPCCRSTPRQHHLGSSQATHLLRRASPLHSVVVVAAEAAVSSWMVLLRLTPSRLARFRLAPSWLDLLQFFLTSYELCSVAVACFVSISPCSLMLYQSY